MRFVVCHRWFGHLALVHFNGVGKYRFQLKVFFFFALFCFGMLQIQIVVCVWIMFVVPRHEAHTTLTTKEKIHFRINMAALLARWFQLRFNPFSFDVFVHVVYFTHQINLLLNNCLENVSWFSFVSFLIVLFLSIFFLCAAKATKWKA